MTLREGINDLRSILSTPKDALFHHLSDLIVALDDASSPSVKRNCDLKFSKTRRKIKRPHDKIDLSAGNVAGSESNIEEGKRGFVSPEGTMEMTDSENELPKRRYSNPWRAPPDPRTLKLVQRSIGVPIESDSFTETFTPARRLRRKRLIKRMAVDSCVDEEPTTDVRCRRSSASMDIELSMFPTSSRHLFTAKRRIRKFGSCHSESSMECDLSSSDTSDTEGNATSDGGHQGDDEQSDWYFEIPKCSKTRDECVMGVPNIRKMLMRKVSRDQAIGLNHYMQTIESSDTDMSQSSNSLKFSKNFGKRLLSKNAPSMSSALNRRIINFLQNSGEGELLLGTLKKRERKEALRLASFYNLDVRCKTSKSIQTYAFLKTKYTVSAM